jgi:hypothetical protein
MLPTGFVDAVFDGAPIRVGFKNLRVFPREKTIKCHEFDALNLTLRGVVPLTAVDSTQTRFGWDAGEHHWGLTLLGPPDSVEGRLCAAYIRNGALPKTSGEIQFDNIFILSNGTGDFTMMEDRKVKLCNLVDFYPTDLLYSGEYVKFKGATAFRIPGTDRVFGYPTYRKKSKDSLEFGFDPVYLTWGAKGTSIVLPADSIPNALKQGPTSPMRQKLTNGLFTAEGVAYEKVDGKQLFRYAIRLTHTYDKTTYFIDTTTEYRTAAGNQRFSMSKDNSKYLDSVMGGAEANTSAWSTLKFKGWQRDSATGGPPQGMGSGDSCMLELTVEGDLVADNQSVGVENVDLGFGEMTITFDYTIPALVGALHIGPEEMAGCELEGDINFYIGAKGWYFFGGLYIGVSGIEAQLAVIFGDYPVDQDETGVVDKFKQYSFQYEMFGAMPDGFNRLATGKERLSGFFFEGGVSFPFVLPSVDINCLIVQASFSCVLGVDLTMGYQFTDGGGEFDFGLMGFAKLEMGVSLSLIVVCVGLEASVEVDLIVEGSIWSNGDYDILGAAGITFKATAYLGLGICTTKSGGGCEGDACVVKSDSGQFGMWFGGRFWRTNSTDSNELGFYFEKPRRYSDSLPGN